MLSDKAQRPFSSGTNEYIGISVLSNNMFKDAQEI